jgi:hypothetical protein
VRPETAYSVHVLRQTLKCLRRTDRTLGIATRVKHIRKAFRKMSAKQTREFFGIEKLRKLKFRIESNEPIQNPLNDNVDVFVRFDGGPSYVATFVTKAYIEEQLNECRKTGEHCNGLYFFWTDLIIVEMLSYENFERVVKDLIATADFEYAFSSAE